MNQEELLRRIKKQANLNAKRRRDARYRETMGFLVAKGFLRTNRSIPLLPSKRLRVADAIWAGKMVEPRILEVLPAAVLRLGSHFEIDPQEHEDLLLVVNQLRKRERSGSSFLGIPFEKLKVWADLPLRDRRVKPIARKRALKTFRLLPETIDALRELAVEQSCSETEVIERALRRPPTLGLEMACPEIEMDNRLRERPRDKAAAESYVSYLRGRAVESANAATQVRLLGELGVWTRRIDALSEAERLLRLALELVNKQNLGIALEIQQRIRLANVLQWQGRFDESTKEFSEIIAVCAHDSVANRFMDFALQHAGKNFFDQSMYEEALEAFEKALNLRQKRKAPQDQLESSRNAAERTREELKRAGPSDSARRK